MKQSTPDSTQLDPLELKFTNVTANTTSTTSSCTTTTKTIPNLPTIPSCSLPNVNLLTTPFGTALSSLAHSYDPAAATNLSLPNLMSFTNPYPNWASSILTALTQNPSATTSLLNLISATALNPPLEVEHAKIRTNSCFPLGRQSMTLTQGHEEDQPLDLTLNSRNRSVSPKLHINRSPHEELKVGTRAVVSQPSSQRSRKSVTSRNQNSRRKLVHKSSDSVVNEPDSTYQSTLEPNETDLAKPLDKPVPTKNEPVRQSTKRDLNRLSDSFSNDDSLTVQNKSTKAQPVNPHGPTMAATLTETLTITTRTNSENRRRKTTASRRPFKVFSRPELTTDPEKLLVETATRNLLTSLVDIGKDSNGSDTCVNLPAQLMKPLSDPKPDRPMRGRRSQSASDGRKQSKTQNGQDRLDPNNPNDDSESSNLQDSMSTKSMDSLPIKSALAFEVKLDASAIDSLIETPTELTESSTDCNPRMRRFPEMTPKEIKDEAYWEKRFKNNEAARRSRRARKSKELCLRQYADRLEQVNTKLVEEIELLKAEVHRLKAEKNMKATS